MKTAKIIIFLLCAILACGCGAPSPGEVVDVTPTAGASAQPSPEATAGEEAVAVENAEVVFLNVGKADSTLIRLGEACYLVDAGTKDGAGELIALLGRLGVTELEGLFLTHGHKDHIGGVEALCAALPVKRLYRSAIAGPESEKLVELSTKTGVAETLLSAGTMVKLAEGAKLEILGPVEYNPEDENDNSLVMRLTVNQHTVLLTGDMQFTQEQTLLQGGIDLSAQVLKVGNHGNPDATGEDFTAAVCAQIAVISTDTFWDDDSANARVAGALIAANPDAQVLVTENDAYGYRVNLAPGELTARGAAPFIEERVEELRAAYGTMLVNRQNLIPADYVPDNLKKVEKLDIPNLTLKSDEIKGDEGALYALKAMMTAAGEEGVTGFYLVSAYRTFEEQQALWDKKVSADPSYGQEENEPIVTAYPGASEHQTGLAFDISAVDAKALSKSFGDTPQGKWLYENCARFGFILRYPDGKHEITKIVFEPWHFRFVGRELASYLTERGLTLEEFYQNF